MLAFGAFAVVCALVPPGTRAEYWFGAMIVFSALASCLAIRGRVRLGPERRGGLRRGQIGGRLVATSRDDFVQFWIDEIAGIAAGGSNPFNGGLSEAHGVPISSTLRASGPVQAAEFPLEMFSSRGGELSEVCCLAPASHLPAPPSRDQERKLAPTRAYAGHCHSGFGVGVSGADSALEFTTQQALRSKSHFPRTALQVRRARIRHPDIRCPRWMTRDRSFRRNSPTPGYGDAVANVGSSRNSPERKRNRGESSCPFAKRS